MLKIQRTQEVEKNFGKILLQIGYIPKEYDYCDEEVMYAGAAFEQWGHFLTEITNRLYWFIENRKNILSLIGSAVSYIIYLTAF